MMEHLFYSYRPSDLSRIPARPADSHKGTFGRVLVIGGAPGMSGAAYFSAKAAYRTGAGLVHILTHEDNRVILQTGLPEAILSTYGEYTNEPVLSAALEKADVIVLGVGLGQSPTAKELVRQTLAKADVPLILDADAINMIAKYGSARSRNANPGV